MKTILFQEFIVVKNEELEPDWDCYRFCFDEIEMDEDGYESTMYSKDCDNLLVTFDRKL